MLSTGFALLLVASNQQNMIQYILDTLVAGSVDLQYEYTLETGNISAL